MKYCKYIYSPPGNYFGDPPDFLLPQARFEFITYPLNCIKVDLIDWHIIFIQTVMVPERRIIDSR